MAIDPNQCYQKLETQLMAIMKRYVRSTFLHVIQSVNYLFIYVGLPSTSRKMGENRIRAEDVKSKAFRWCKKSIGGAWTRISKEDLEIKPIR